MEPPVRLKVLVFSHLTDAKMENREMANKRIEFAKWLMNKYEDLNVEVYANSEFSAFEREKRFI